MPASLAGGSLLGPPLRGLPRLRVIGRQRLGEVGQDAAEKLGLVGGLWGCLLRIGEEKMRFGFAMLRQELRGVRQFFGMRRARGTAMKALVEGGHQRLRLGLQGVGGAEVLAWMGVVWRVEGERGMPAWACALSREKRPSALLRVAGGWATAGPGPWEVAAGRPDRVTRATGPRPPRHPAGA